MKKLLILAFLLLGCFSMASYAAKPKAKHVVYIGLDGWGSYSMPKANMPTVKSLMETGCYTMQKRTVLPSSSAVNWASMFMGAGPEVHGYTEWGSRTPELPSRVIVKNNIFPTIFQIYRDANPKAEIGVLSEWAGIQFLVDTLSTDYHAVAPDYNKFPTALCEMAEKYIKENKPSLVAICFDNPDHVGHKEGHDTPAYYSKLEELDGYIARHYNQVSDFGKFMDPLADKCLVMAALCWFVEEGAFAAWVLAIVLLREFAVSGMRLVAVEKGRVIAAGWSGKVKTASTMVCICLILLGIPQVLNYVCQGIILVTTVYSGVEYFAKNADVFKEVK